MRRNTIAKPAAKRGRPPTKPPMPAPVKPAVAMIDPANPANPDAQGLQYVAGYSASQMFIDNSPATATYAPKSAIVEAPLFSAVIEYDTDGPYPELVEIMPPPNPVKLYDMADDTYSATVIKGLPVDVALGIAEEAMKQECEWFDKRQAEQQTKIEAARATFATLSQSPDTPTMPLSDTESVGWRHMRREIPELIRNGLGYSQNEHVGLNAFMMLLLNLFGEPKHVN